MANKSSNTQKNMNAYKTKDELHQRITKPEQMLGRALNQPFSNTNSGSRKLMFSSQSEQRLPLSNPEVALISTGYESEFGRYSSSYHEADANYAVLKKIPKFSFKPEQCYVLIVQNLETMELDVIDRTPYEHITESYGYLQNNRYLDSLMTVEEEMQKDDTEFGYLRKSTIGKGDVFKKSTSFDDYNNRLDGVNLLTAYISTAKNTEDSVILSQSAARQLTSPLINKVKIIINDNDILLNLYGNNTVYKVFPDIGESIERGMLCALRREKKEESLFAQSYKRLTDILMSDETFIVDGEVIDIDIFCNNVEVLNSSIYNSQLKFYYDEKLRFSKEVCNFVEPLLSTNNGLMTHALQKLLFKCQGMVAGKQYTNNENKAFSGTVLEITVLEENKISIGDKLSDRYGGKGVISFILPDEEMPLIKGGDHVDIIYNSCTCLGRLNPGQMFETSLTFIGNSIISFILLNVLDIDQAIDLYRQYLAIVDPAMDEWMEDKLDPNTPIDEKERFLTSMMEDKGIAVSLEPISDSMTIDRLADVYKEFTAIASQIKLLMPLRDSNGNLRYVDARRPMVVGYKYIYRLKQYAKDKFSATSLSPTNIKNQNTRSKANKQYKSPFTQTPVRMGDMETGNMLHAGAEYVTSLLMLYSSSPHGRRQTSELYTGNPFEIDIRLDNNSKNRNVEILNARLKTIGLRLEFKRVPKNILKNPLKRIKKNPIKRLKKNPIMRVTETKPENKFKWFNPIRKIKKDPIKRLDK